MVCETNILFVFGRSHEARRNYGLKEGKDFCLDLVLALILALLQVRVAAVA